MPCACKNPERFFFSNFYGFDCIGKGNVVSNKTQIFISLSKRCDFNPFFFFFLFSGCFSEMVF